MSSFGDSRAALLVIGLAPGLRGANRTGRPFTGDYAGELLYATLQKFGFARGRYQADLGDGLELIDCRITNAVRCVPPENKPTPAEAANCAVFLQREATSMPRLRAVLTLGAIAHRAAAATFGLSAARHKFRHGARHLTAGGLAIVNSYHCSRYNTNTGRLTTAMFEQVVGGLAALIDAR